VRNRGLWKGKRGGLRSKSDQKPGLGIKKTILLEQRRKKKKKREVKDTRAKWVLKKESDQVNGRSTYGSRGQQPKKKEKGGGEGEKSQVYARVWVHKRRGSVHDPGGSIGSSSLNLNNLKRQERGRGRQ